MRIDRWTKLFRTLGVEDPESTALELAEEDAARRRSGRSAGPWRWYQTASIILYSLRDAVWRRPGGKGGRGLEPGRAVRVAWRSVRRDAATALTGAATLAVGFGAAATIFAVWEGFNRPLPVPEGRDIVQIRFQGPERNPVSPTWSQVRERGLQALGSQGTYALWEPVVRGPEGSPRRMSAARISRDGFETLETQPMVGRLPESGEADAVLVSPTSWSRLAPPGTDWEDALGASLTVEGRAMTVVGVMPETFGFPLNQQLWTLLGTGDEDLPVEAFGRMNPGADTRAATVEATARWVPDIAPGGSVQVLGFTEARGEGGENAMLLAVLALVLVLVLVSCSNVSNLLLMRGLDRGGQLAVHQALGASPSQVGWLVLAESAIIAGIGAAVGAGVAWAAIGFIQESLSGHWGYHWMHVAFRPRTVLFLAGLGAVTSLVAGFIPAVRAFGADVRGGLSARESRGNARGLGWVGPTLLTAQVSLSFLFLLAAVLIGRGLWSSRAVNPAFPADEVFLVGVQRPDGSVDRPDFARAVERALLTDPAVGNAAVATGVPGYRTTVRRLERPSSRDDVGTRPDVVGATAVTPGYFDLFGIPTLRGRTFQAGDMAPDGPRVAVVSRAFAEEELGTMEATGLRVSLQTLGPESPVESFEILGVVDDVRIYSDQPKGRPVYLPLTRDRTRSVFLLFRGENLQADQARLAANRALAAIDPDLPLEGSPGAGEAGTVGDVLDYIRTLYSTAGIMGILGGAAAVAVAVMGLYGILSYQMRRRRRELGIRVALGAGRSSVITQVVSLGLRSLAPGLVLGCVAALAAIPLLGVLLGSGRARDGLLFGAVAAAYALVGLAASLPPALRASRTDPNLILRED